MSGIGVTGSTGAVGGAVARELAGTGVPLRLLVRDPSRAPQLPGAQVAAAAYGDTPDAVRALRGVRTLLLVSGAESPTRLDEHRGFLDAAARAGVAHVVYTSFLAASPTCTFTLGRDHWATEEHLRASGMASTILRDNFYLDVFPFFAVDGVIRGPAGDGRVSAVARADVARVAALVLREPSAHAGAVHDLTGPESLTLSEVAATMTDVTGRLVRFEDETVDEAYRSRARGSPQPWQADAWVSTYTAIASGELAGVSSSVRDLTGREPLTLRDVLQRRRRR